MRKIIFGLVFLFVQCNFLFAAKIVLTGHASDYNGQKIVFLHYDNQITYKEYPLGSVIVGANGDFSCSFNINETTFVFAHLGTYFTSIFVEPGREYNISLPSRKDKLPGEKINPYFEEDKIHFSILSVKQLNSKEKIDPKSELNYWVTSFDAIYEPVFAKYSMNAYIKKKKENLDSMILSLDSTYANGKNVYFNEYYQYRIGLLKFMSKRVKSKYISDGYFLNKPILYNNPAYMELFNQVYEKYLVYFGRTSTGKEIYDDINTHKSLSQLKATLHQDQVLSNDTLKELVILKGIHDGFYEMDFSRQSMLDVLDSLQATTKIAIHKAVTANIREKVTKLLSGYDPPSFRLLNQDSMWVSNSDLKGTLTYLVFCTTQNYVCFKEFDQLKKIQQKYGNLIKIVTISVDDSLPAMRSFCKKYPYNWTFLYFGDQPEVIKDYDIRTFPTYYMIDSDGKMLFSPAKSPFENIEITIFDYLRGKKLL